MRESGIARGEQLQGNEQFEGVLVLDTATIRQDSPEENDSILRKSARHGVKSARHRRVPDDARAAVGLLRLGDHRGSGCRGHAAFSVVPGRLLDFDDGIGRGRG